MAGKTHPINKQKSNKLEKRQCLQKLGESTTKRNTKKTSLYPFLQVKLLQIVLKWNEIYFLSTEFWLFCYWHFFMYLSRHCAFFAIFRSHSHATDFINISTSTADINSSHDQFFVKRFSLGKKICSFFSHY